MDRYILVDKSTGRIQAILGLPDKLSVDQDKYLVLDYQELDHHYSVYKLDSKNKLVVDEQLLAQYDENQLQALRASKKSELYRARLELNDKPFTITIGGMKYNQYNREIDQSNADKYATLMLATKATGNPMTHVSWKFYDQDNQGVVVALDMNQLMKLAQIMMARTNSLILSEIKMISKIDASSVEELNKLDFAKYYEDELNKLRASLSYAL